MHKIALSVFGFPIYSYGLMMLVGVILGYLLVLYRNSKIKLSNTDTLTDCFIFILLFGIAGARLAYVFLHWDNYSDNLLSILNLRAGGLTLYGGLFGGVVTFILFSKIKRLNVMKMLDLFAPSVILGIAFGRIGCFLNGCCYGIEAPVGFGVIFPDLGANSPRYPIQLYEASLCVIACFAIIFFDKIKKNDGESFLLMISAYAATRFLIEFFRDIDSSPILFNLTAAQIFSLILIFTSILLIFMKRLEKPSNAGK